MSAGLPGVQWLRRVRTHLQRHQQGTGIHAHLEYWLETNNDSGRVSGARPIDVRMAIIEPFRDQESIRELEKRKRCQRQCISDVEGESMEKRDKLIEALEGRMQQRTSTIRIFTIPWQVS